MDEEARPAPSAHRPGARNQHRIINRASVFRCFNGSPLISNSLEPALFFFFSQARCCLVRGRLAGAGAPARGGAEPREHGPSKARVAAEGARARGVGSLKARRRRRGRARARRRRDPARGGGIQLPPRGGGKPMRRRGAGPERRRPESAAAAAAGRAGGRRSRSHARLPPCVPGSGSRSRSCSRRRGGALEVWGVGMGEPARGGGARTQ